MGGVDLHRYGPVALVASLVIAPLAIWAATSGSGGDPGRQGLILERSLGTRGESELLISIDADDVRATRRSSTVGLRCVDAAGGVVMRGTIPWPFAQESAYDLPHAHQPAPQDDLDRLRTCALLGTDKRLEAEVQ